MALPTLEQFVPETNAYQLPLISGHQQDCIQELIRQAAFDESIANRLIKERDDELRKQYQITSSTWTFIHSFQATTLDKLCVELYKSNTIAVSY